MTADFSGWVTKAGLKCSDGRTILKDAFKHQDGIKVPLVWRHDHDRAENVLGHVLLENRDEGVYGYGYFNNTPQGQNAKALVEHEDINALSIFANKLKEQAKRVAHGMIREVSLVMAGANPGALIDFVNIAHEDGSIETLDDEAVIFTGLQLEHEQPSEDSNDDDDLDHADGSDKTVQEVYDSMSEEQKQVVHYMIGAAVGAEGSASHSDSDNTEDQDGDEGDLEHKDNQEGTDVKHNVFDQNKKDGDEGANTKTTLTHDDMQGILADFKAGKGTLKDCVDRFAVQHGIENIEGLFPEAKDLNGGAPEWVTRRMEWVSGVLGGVRKSPFSRIKTRTADLTQEEARAFGYIKGNFKKEQWFAHTSRTTGPTTVYKKQKLDRDDIVDITDFDVVAWIRAEMRVMLEEELAGAILVGDGRPQEDPANPGEPNPDKIADPAGAASGNGIRAIINENDFYARQTFVELDDNNYLTYGQGLVEAVLLEREFYRGSGQPTFYTTQATLTRALLARDQMGRRLYRNKQELATEMQVADIVPVEILPRGGADLVGILVNLSDYVVGADRGGEVNLFDDFDIDYNQYKYLIETRISGALAKIFSAQILRRRATTDNAVTAPAPTFDGDTITIPTSSTVDYFVDGAPAADGSTHAVAEGDTAVVTAEGTGTNYTAPGTPNRWTFTNAPG